MVEEAKKYYDENSWKKCFNVDVAELYRSVEGLLKLRDKLKRELTSDSVIQYL